jgi:hypothetical protein
MYSGLDQCWISVGESYHTQGGLKPKEAFCHIKNWQSMVDVDVCIYSSDGVVPSRCTIIDVPLTKFKMFITHFKAPVCFQVSKIQSDMGRKRKNRPRPTKKNNTRIAERTRSQINLDGQRKLLQVLVIGDVILDGLADHLLRLGAILGGPVLIF